jgi:protein phosphatase
MTTVFDLAGQAIQGARDYQEDFCDFAVAGSDSAIGPGIIRLEKEQELLAVLADGMGGHAGGAEASSLACQSFLAAYKGTKGMPQERLAAALAASNHAIAERIQRDMSLNGMGCTFLGVLFDAHGMRWISVGDSRLFLYRNGELIHINEDHSMAPILDKLVEQGKMIPDEAEHHPQRNHLRSALTGSQIDLIQLHDQSLPLDDNDWILVASDGILTLSEAEIEYLIEDNASGGSQCVVNAILKAVENAAAPYQDNTTIIAIRPGTRLTASASN